MHHLTWQGLLRLSNTLTLCPEAASAHDPPQESCLVSGQHPGWLTPLILDQGSPTGNIPCGKSLPSTSISPPEGPVFTCLQDMEAFFTGHFPQESEEKWIAGEPRLTPSSPPGQFREERKDPINHNAKTTGADWE